MQRILVALATGYLLAGVAFQTGCAGEAPEADMTAPVTDAKPATPERWLDVRMAAPEPRAVRPDGRQVVVTAGCETILYDLESGNRLHAWTDRFVSACFSADGRFLLTVGDNEVAVWDAETCTEIRRFPGRAPAWNEPHYRSLATIAALSDDGSQLAIANRRGSFHRDMPAAVLVYNTRSDALRQALATPEKAEVHSVAVVPNSERLLVGYSSRRENDVGRCFCVLWDMESGNPVCELPVEGAVRVSPDGRWIAGGTLVGSPFQAGGGTPRIDSTRLTVWETDAGKAVRTFEYASPMRDFTFRPNGERVLVALERKTGDGPRLAFAGRLVEWDVESGEARFEVDHPAKPYASVAYSPDGLRRFATTEWPNGLDDDVDHRLCGWSVKTGAELPIRNYLFDSYNGREDLFFYTSGDRFIDLACPFAVRDVFTGVVEKTLPEYRRGMTEVAFAADGERFLVGPREVMGACYLSDCRSGDQRTLRLRGEGPVFLDGGRNVFAHNVAHLRLIDVVSDEVVWGLPLHAHYRRFDAAISPDAKRVVVSQESDPDLPAAPRVILLETSQPDRPRILQRYAARVAFRPDGACFLAASPEAIDEFDALSGDHIRTLWTPPGRPLAVTYSQDGTRVLACGVVGHADRREPVDRTDRGWAMLWDDATNRTISLKGHTAPVTTAAFGAGGARCATGSLDTTIRLWDSANGSPLSVLHGHVGGIHRIDYSRRGDRILSAALDGAALWNVARFATPPVEPVPLAASFRPVESGNAINATFGAPKEPMRASEPESPPSQPAPVPAVRPANWVVVEVGEAKYRNLSPDIEHWLSRARATRRRDVPPSTEPARPASRHDLCGTSRDGRRKVYLTWPDKNIALCDEEGRTLRTWDGRTAYSSHVRISPSGKEVIISRRTGSGEGGRWIATVYDAESGLAKRVIGEDDGKYLSLTAIDPKERTIMMSTSEYAIVLRDYQTGERLGALARDRGGPSRKAAYSPDGRFVVTGKFPELAVTLYDPTTLAPVKTLASLLPVRWFAFSPDERHLVVGQLFGHSSSDLLTMWEIDSGRRLWSRCGPCSDSATFSPDGRRFVTDGRSGSSRVWTFWDAEAGQMLCIVLASAGVAGNKAVLGGDGASLHLGSTDGPRLWPE